VLLSLIGMPGGGKSTVGRHLAKRLNVPFLDTDAVIEQRIGEPIRCFFEREGEARFRDLEQDVLAHIAATSTGVLATGGGAVLRPANRLLLHERSTVLYLSTTPEAIGRRLRTDTKRPLLQVANPLQRLRELHAERDPLYQQTAHFVIATGRTSIATLISTILMQLELAGVVDFYTVSSPVDPLLTPAGDV
jgi:shikimate kinase